MKRLPLTPLLLALLLVSCSNNKKYKSYREANDACKKWAEKGGTFNVSQNKSSQKLFIVDGKISKKQKVFKVPLRWCDEEVKTKQFLGLEANRKKNSNWEYTKYCSSNCDKLPQYEKKESTVKANFYY
tara:strand:+ start:89 stop:472 length:384 start_codon:yes stop_codon:yes gene_type:complete